MGFDVATVRKSLVVSLTLSTRSFRTNWSLHMFLTLVSLCILMDNDVNERLLTELGLLRFSV